MVQASLGQDTGLVEITPFLRAGLNTLTFSLDNFQQGYTYGFDVYREGVLYLRDQCGIFDSIGCNGNDQMLGGVYTRTLLIRP